MLLNAVLNAISSVLECVLADYGFLSKCYNGLTEWYWVFNMSVKYKLSGRAEYDPLEVLNEFRDKPKQTPQKLIYHMIGNFVVHCVFTLK